MSLDFIDPLLDIADQRVRAPRSSGNVRGHVRELIRAGIDSGELVAMSDSAWATLHAVACSLDAGQFVQR